MYATNLCEKNYALSFMKLTPIKISNKKYIYPVSTIKQNYF